MLSGEIPDAMLKGKIVLVGATALGMNDLLTTPVSGLGVPMSGVEFHANVIESLRHDRLIEQPHAAVVMVVCMLLALTPLIWMPKVSSLSSLMSNLLFMIGLGVMAALAPKTFAIWIPPSAALIPIMLAYPIWSWRKLEAAQRFLDEEFKHLKQSLLDTQHPIEMVDDYDRFEQRIKQVRLAADQLRYLQQDKKETLAFISHDLRTPIASSLATLKNHPELAPKMEAALSQALHLAEDFLQASRAEMMTKDLFQELDLVSLTQQAVDDVYELAKAKLITIQCDLPEGMMWMLASFGLLHRAISNLIINAVKFSPEGSHVDVKLFSDQRDTIACIEITDNGPGISKQQQSQLFKRFSKSHDRAETSGAGLGLYFVNTVVTKHGGTMSLESEQGQYTRFIIRVPIKGFQPHTAL
jgi:signal transduction histidine kinase